LLSDGPLMWWVLGGSVLALIAALLARHRRTSTTRRRGDAAPDGREPSSWQDYFTNVPEAVPFRGIFTFSYEDADGGYTRRTVNALMIIPRPDRVTLFGFCHHRDQYRHFNLARVKDMVDAESGEIIENPGLDLVLRCRGGPAK
jgi:predicted DNA-binding transcriptional regulator YafY